MDASVNAGQDGVVEPATPHPARARQPLEIGLSDVVATVRSSGRRKLSAPDPKPQRFDVAAKLDRRVCERNQIGFELTVISFKRR